MDGIETSERQRNFHAGQDDFLYILNKFVETGVIPEEVKTAPVRHHSQDVDAKNNLRTYRTMSELPTLPVGLEKHLFLSRTDLLEKWPIFSSTHHGFIRPNAGITGTALTHTIHNFGGKRVGVHSSLKFLSLDCF